MARSRPRAVDSTRVGVPGLVGVFPDPRLTKLIQLAYQQNLTLRAAGVRVFQARAQLGVALGEFCPQQQQWRVITYNQIPISLPYDFITNTYWEDLFGAQVAWEIDVWGKFRRAVESADGGYLASVASYDDVLVTLTGDVANTYVQIRCTERQSPSPGTTSMRQRRR